MSRLSIVLAATVIAVSLLVSPNFRGSGDAERMPYAGDFLNEWTGAWIVHAGDRARLYDPSYFIPIEHDARLVGFRLRADAYAPMVYPPAYYLLVSPLAALSYREAAWVWIALMLACFAAAIAVLARALRDDASLHGLSPSASPALRRLVALLALPLAVSFMPFAENLVSGQKATVWLLILTVAFAALRRGWPMMAGLVLGLLALKPQLVVVVPAVLLAKREWRFALGAFCTMALVIAISVAVSRELTATYVHFAADTANYIRRQPAYLYRLHSMYAFFTLLAGDPTVGVRVATLAAASGVVWLLVRLFQGPLDVRSARFLEQYAGLVVATVLLSPHVVTYDLTILLLPMALCGALLVSGTMEPARRRSMLWLLVTSYVAGGVSPSVARATGVQLTTPVMAALLAFLAFGKMRAADVDEAPPVPA